jgi:hypothetical protein
MERTQTLTKQANQEQTNKLSLKSPSVLIRWALIKSKAFLKLSYENYLDTKTRLITILRKRKSILLPPIRHLNLFVKRMLYYIIHIINTNKNQY